MKAKEYLLMAQKLDPNDQAVAFHIKDTSRVEDLIKTGRVPASDLDYNLKIKSSKDPSSNQAALPAR